MIKFNDLAATGKYVISSVSNPVSKFSGMGLVPGNEINVRHISKRLIRFDIGLTSFFARRCDLEVSLIKITD